MADGTVHGNRHHATGEELREDPPTGESNGTPANDPLLVPLFQARTSRWVGDYPCYSAEELKRVAVALDARSISQLPPKWNHDAPAGFVAEAEAFRAMSSSAHWFLPRLVFVSRCAGSIPWLKYTPKHKGWPYWVNSGNIGEWLEERWLLKRATPSDSPYSYYWNLWGDRSLIPVLVKDTELEVLHDALRSALKDSVPKSNAFYVVRAAGASIHFSFHHVPQDALLLGEWLRILSSCKEVVLRIIELSRTARQAG